jgi:phage protein D
VSPSVDTGVMLALIEVKIKGVVVHEGLIQEVRVQDSLALPAAFSITFTPRELSRGVDPLGVEGVDPSIGAEVQIFLGAPRDKQRQKLFDGEITALEPNFGPEGIRLVASGYDRSHRLQRGRKTRTFQKMTTSNIVQKLAGDAGLTARTEAIAVQHEFVQQNNETDWEFLRRLASMHDCEALVDGRSLVLRKTPTTAPQPLELEYGENTSNGAAVRLQSFYPRATAAQQVKEVSVRSWDPKGKKAIEAKSAVPKGGTSIGINRDQAIKDFGTSVLTVADAPVSSQEEAQALAESLASYLDAFVGAFGTCEGNPRVRAGTTLKIKGLGPEFSGKYRCSATTHVYGGGYTTSFEVLGRSPRDLLDLASPARRNTWGDSLVVGIVTNNRNDPNDLARVRVKYPALDGSTNEGAWARVIGIGAGKERGQMMLPQVDDEVLIGFEGGDPHKPYVLGALWNGQDKHKPDHLNPAKPGDPPDGSYVLRSPKLIDMASLDNVKIKTGKDMIVEVEGKSTETVQKTQEVTVKQTFKLDAASELTLVCGQAKIVLKQSGEIQITGSNVTVEGQMSAKLKGSTVGVEGTGPVTVKGATVAIN